MIFTTKNKELAIFGQTLSEVRKKLIDFNEIWMQGGRFGSNKPQLIPEENLIKELSFDEAKNKLDNFTNIVIKGNKTLDEYFAMFPENNDVLKTYVTTTDQQSQSIQGLVKASQEARATQIAHNKELENMSFSAKAGQAAFQALATAGNMLAMLAISKGIELAATGLDKLIVTSKEAKEASNAYMSSLNSLQGEFSSNSQTISSLNDRYKELASGVDNMGNNISLTTEEYKEYKDIISKVSDLLPDLEIYYNSQGEKIGFVNEKLKDLNKTYDEYQKKSAKDFLTNDNEDEESLDDMITQFNRTNSDSSGLWGNNTGFWGGFAAFYKDQFGDKSAINDILSSREQLNRLIELQSMTQEEFNERMQHSTFNYDRAIVGLHSNPVYSPMKKLKGNSMFSTEELKDAKDNIPSLIKQLNDAIDVEMGNLREILSMELFSFDEYYDLDDDKQTILSGFISNLDEDTLRAAGILNENGEIVKNKLSEVTKNWISIIDEKGVSDSLNKLLNLNIEEFDGSIEELNKYITKYSDSVADAFGIDGDSLKKAFGLDTLVDDYYKNNQKLRETFFDLIKLQDITHAQPLDEFLKDISVGDLTIALGLDFTTNPEEIQEKLNELSEGGNVDLAIRPKISPETMNEAGWDFKDENTSLYSATYGNSDNTSYMNFTPVLPDGTVMEKNSFEEYCQKVVNGVTDDSLELKIGADFNSVEEAEKAAKKAQEWSELQFAVNEAANGHDLDGVIEILEKMIDAEKELSSYSYSPADIFAFENAEGKATELGKINGELDKIQNAYDTLSDLVNSYDENGFISIDQLQSLISLGGNFLDYLVDEEGNLRTDTEAMQQLAAARLLEMKAKIQQGIIDNVTNIQNETQANDYLASTNYALAGSIKEVTKAKLDEWKVNALKNNMSPDIVDSVYNKANADFDKTEKLFSETNIAPLFLGSGSNSSKGSSNSSGSKNTDTKTPSKSEKKLDFFEYRIKEYEELLDSLEAHLDNITGSKARNIVIDDIIKVQSLKQSDLQKGIDMYRSQADELFNKIPEQYRSAAQNGALAVVNFIETSSGENDTIAETIEKYRDLSEKVTDYETKLEELNKELRELQKQKFDNIANDFEKLLNVVSDSTDKLNDLVDLQEKQYGTSSTKFYDELIAQEKERLNLLNQEKQALQAQMDSALLSGSIRYGSDDWNDMNKTIQDINSSILESVGSLEDFQDAVHDIHWENFDEFYDQISNIQDEVNNVISLMEREDLFKTKKAGNASQLADIFNISPDSDELKFGETMWTDNGTATLGLYVQAMQIAQYNAEQCSEALKELNKAYERGEYSLEEYNKKHDELLDKQWQEINNYNSAKDSIKDLYDNYVDAQIDSIDKEVDAYSKLIEKQKETLQRLLDENEAQKELLESKKNLTDINAQILAMSGDTSDAGIAKRLMLEQELEDSQQDYDDKVYTQNITDQQEALDYDYELFYQAKEKEKTALEESKNNSERIIQEVTDFALQNASTVLSTLWNISSIYGIEISNAITTPWMYGEEALARYDETMFIRSGSLQFQLELIKSKTYEVQSQADITAQSLMTTFGVSSATLQGELSFVYNGLQLDIGRAENLHSQLEKLFNANDLDVSNLIGMINSINTEVDKVKDSVILLSKYINDVNNQEVNPSINPNAELKNFRIINSNTGQELLNLGTTTRADAEKKFQEFLNTVPRTSLMKYNYRLQAYATGGTIRQTDGIKLNHPLPNGDDRFIVVKPGEGILTPDQNEAWQNISHIVPQLNTYLADMIRFPDYSKNISINPPNNTINYSSGDVIVQGNLDNVTLKDVEKTINTQFDKFTRAALP